MSEENRKGRHDMETIKCPQGPDYEALVKAAVAKVAEEKGGRARAYTVDVGDDGKGRADTKEIDIDDVVEVITVEGICIGDKFNVWDYSNCGGGGDCNLCVEKFLRKVFTPSEAKQGSDCEPFEAGPVARIEALEATIAEWREVFERYGLVSAAAKMAEEKGARVVNENRKHEGSGI